MSYLLNIDTSNEIASVSIAKDGLVIESVQNHIQKEHAGFLHPAIEKLLKVTKMDLKEMDAIAVTEGPGSYTGLRVGMASAKGLCYALDKPLITVGTLDSLALAAIRQSKEVVTGSALFCPMIDARRMEVFTAVFDSGMKKILSERAMILEKSSFSNLFEGKQMIFMGNGAEKWKSFSDSDKYTFIIIENIRDSMAQLSHNKLITNDFANLANVEPLYLKAFHFS